MCLIKLFSLWLFRSTGQCCLLLKHKANHHLPNHQGQTALDIAVHNSDADIVTLLRLAALNEEIRENDWIHIGVSMTSNEATENFKAMKFSKRKCYMSRSISRTECLTKNVVYEYAKSICKCVPKGIEHNDYTICNITGAYCFNEAVSNAKINLRQCPIQCSNKEYHTHRSQDTFNNPLSLGQDFIDFLLDNPIGMILTNNTFGNENGQY